MLTVLAEVAPDLPDFSQPNDRLADLLAAAQAGDVVGMAGHMREATEVDRSSIVVVMLVAIMLLRVLQPMLQPFLNVGAEKWRTKKGGSPKEPPGDA